MLLKIEELKLKNKIFPAESYNCKYWEERINGYVTNLNLELTRYEKYVLIMNNWAKLSWIQIIYALQFGCERLLLLPIIYGVINAEDSIYSLAIFFVLYHLYFP